MAKQLLASYRIGGDVIDQVSSKTFAERVLPSLDPLSSEEGSASSEQPAVAGSRTEQDSKENPQPEALNVVSDGLHRVFSLAGIQYRVSGAKSIFVTSLRVNIRATHEGLSHYDSLDLYTAKARASFAATLNRAWGAEVARVEKDLILILEHFEKERDDRLRSGSQKPVISMNAQEREQGMKLLMDPRLFDRIVDDLSALGYVGEDLNKQLLYLCASSRKLADPMSVLILSQSASGKSFLVESVRRLMPPEDVVAVTSLSDQALNYIEDLSHKFLILGEAVHGEVVEHQIREMLSGKELSRLVTIKDPETGTMKSTVVRTPVIVSSVMSSTSYAINPENASRCFMINTDESKAQTERIHEYQRSKYSLDRVTHGAAAKDEIIRTHQTAQRLLQNRVIVNEFAPLLDFPSTLMRLRRDHDRFLDLIASVCFLRQYQKQVQRLGSLAYIACDLIDYAVAYRIMVEAVLSSTLRELPKGAQLLYDEMRKLARTEAKRQDLSIFEVNMTQRQIREVSGFAQTWVRENLRSLVDFEYVLVNRGGQERSKGFYHLKEDGDIKTVDVSMIPSPQEMATRLSKKG
jgi:energy-coupling factor transporter ATP-binding protein EcfA2